MLFRKPKLTRIADTQDEFEQQMIDFLQEQGLPTDKETCTLYCVMIQHSDQKEDSYDGAALAKAIRKARANSFAYLTMNPEKKPTNDSQKAPTDLETKA